MEGLWDLVHPYINTSIISIQRIDELTIKMRIQKQNKEKTNGKKSGIHKTYWRCYGTYNQDNSSTCYSWQQVLMHSYSMSRNSSIQYINPTPNKQLTFVVWRRNVHVIFYDFTIDMWNTKHSPQIIYKIFQKAFFTTLSYSIGLFWWTITYKLDCSSLNKEYIVIVTRVIRHGSGFGANS